MPLFAVHIREGADCDHAEQELQRSLRSATIDAQVSVDREQLWAFIRTNAQELAIEGALQPHMDDLIHPRLMSVAMAHPHKSKNNKPPPLPEQDTENEEN